MGSVRTTAYRFSISDPHSTTFLLPGLANYAGEESLGLVEVRQLWMSLNEDGLDENAFERLFMRCPSRRCNALLIRPFEHLHSRCRDPSYVGAEVWNGIPWPDLLDTLVFGMTETEERSLLWKCPCGTTTTRTAFKWHPCTTGPNLMDNWVDTDVED